MLIVLGCALLLWILSTGVVQRSLLYEPSDAWMLGEDALDKFLVKKFEEKVHNTVARAIVRIGLNPTRSMANLSRFQKPWYRATRIPAWHRF